MQKSAGIQVSSPLPETIAVNLYVVIVSDVSCTCSGNLKLLRGTPSTKNSAALTEHVVTEALRPK